MLQQKRSNRPCLAVRIKSRGDVPCIASIQALRPTDLGTLSLQTACRKYETIQNLAVAELHDKRPFASQFSDHSARTLQTSVPDTAADNDDQDEHTYSPVCSCFLLLVNTLTSIVQALGHE